MLDAIPKQLLATFSGLEGCARLTGLSVGLARRDWCGEATWRGRADWDGCPGRVPIEIEWWPGVRPDQADSRLFVSRCVDPDGQAAILSTPTVHGPMDLAFGTVVCSKAVGCPYCEGGGVVTITLAAMDKTRRGDAETRRRGERDLVASPLVARLQVSAETAENADGRSTPDGNGDEDLPDRSGDGRSPHDNNGEGIPSTENARTPAEAVGLSPRLRVSASPRLGAKPRVAIVTPSLWLGGVERWICQLVQATADRLDWVGVAVIDENLAQPDAIAGLRRMVPVYGFGTTCARPIFGADAIVAWGSLALPHVLDGYPGKIVLVSHSDCNGYTRHVVRSAAKICTHFVAVSEYAKGPFAGAVPAARVDVIPNGIDLARCLPLNSRATARAQWGFAPDDCVFGCVTRFSLEKRLDCIVGALEHLPSRYKCLLLGDGFPDVVGGIHELATRFPGRVKLLAPTRAIGDALAAMDVFVVASESEGFCLAALEAMAARDPLVATSVGVLPEAQRSCGGDPPWEPLPANLNAQRIAEAIRRVDGLGRREREARLDKAEEIVRSGYSLEIFADNWVHYLETAIHATPEKRLVHSP